MKIEHIIRDWLALNPDFIEEGLQVIEKEHYLPDELGTSGFIDILCKDIYNNFVIVEIKRSDIAARQTFTEVLKYAELIKSVYNARNSEIKIIIISTHWNEIIRAFSHFCFTSSFPIQGLQVYLNDQTKIPESKEEIIPISSTSFSRKFISTQIIYLFTSLDKRQKAHVVLHQKLLQARVSDYVIIDLDAPKNKPHLYPYAINVAFQKHSIKELLHSISLLNGEHHLDMMKEDFEDNNEYLDYLEQVFIVALEMGNYTDSIEVGYAEKFESITGIQNWTVSAINKYGIFHKDPRYNTELLLKELKGHDGNSLNKFVGFSDSTQKERLKEIRSESQNCLIHTPSWSELIDHILFDLEKSVEKFKVIVDIYNPDSIVTSLYFTLTNDDPHYLPLFQIFVHYANTNKTEFYVGGISSMDVKPSLKLFTSMNYNEIASEIFRIQLSPDNEMDAIRMGLRYSVARIITIDNQEVSNQLIELDNNRIVQDMSKYISIEDYINNNKEAISIMINNYNRIYMQI